MHTPHAAYVFALTPKFYSVAQAVKGCELSKIYMVVSLTEQTEVPIPPPPFDTAQYLEKDILTLIQNLEPGNRSERDCLALRPRYGIDAIQIDRILYNSSVRQLLCNLPLGRSQIVF